MELGLRKWLPTSSPNKTVYSFPRHSQSVVCLCACESEASQELFLGADLRACWEFTRGNKKEDQQRSGLPPEVGSCLSLPEGDPAEEEQARERRWMEGGL